MFFLLFDFEDWISLGINARHECPLPGEYTSLCFAQQTLLGRPKKSRISLRSVVQHVEDPEEEALYPSVV